MCIHVQYMGGLSNVIVYIKALLKIYQSSYSDQKLVNNFKYKWRLQSYEVWRHGGINTPMFRVFRSFWVATQRVFAYYRHFRTAHRFNFEWSVSPRGMDIFNCWGWNRNTVTKRQTYCRCLDWNFENWLFPVIFCFLLHVTLKIK